MMWLVKGTSVILVILPVAYLAVDQWILVTALVRWELANELTFLLVMELLVLTRTLLWIFMATLVAIFAWFYSLVQILWTLIGIAVAY